MTDAVDDVDKLYDYCEKLNEAQDKAQNWEYYEGIIAAANGSVKAKQLAAQMIPKFFKYFPELSEQALDQHFCLCDDDDLGVRVQAIRGFPLFCKDSPDNLAKIVDVLGQLLVSGDNVERDAVHKALMTLLRQDIKTSLTALFKHIGSTDDRNSEDTSEWDTIREKVLCFIRDKVFPLKSELLRPRDEMERYITNLVKQNLQDVTAAEFKMFMDFLRSLNLFGADAPVERVQELVEIIEGQADLDAQFNVSDGDHIARYISCLQMALPFFVRGASSSKFFSYLSKQIIPVFDKFPEEQKIDLLKTVAECSLYVKAQDSRQLLPSVVQLLKKYMVKRRIEEMNFTILECLLFSFQHLAHKAPNATNSLCGYKIVTGQPSDRLGEDFSEQYRDFTERLSIIEELAKAMNKKLTHAMAENNRAMAAAKTEEEKESIKKQKQNTAAGLRSCNNILAMSKPLHSKTPSFIGDQTIVLSWKDRTKAAVTPTPAAASNKRQAASAPSGSRPNAFKKRRGGLQAQILNKGFRGVNNGTTFTSVQGRGRGKGRGVRGRIYR